MDFFLYLSAAIENLKNCSWKVATLEKQIPAFAIVSAKSPRPVLRIRSSVWSIRSNHDVRERARDAVRWLRGTVRDVREADLVGRARVHHQEGARTDIGHDQGNAKRSR